MKNLRPLSDVRRDLRDHPNSDGTIKFPLEAGLLVRSRVRQELERMRWEYDGLTIKWQEVKGLIVTRFYVIANGDAPTLLAMLDDLAVLLKELE